ncbi:MAG: family 43 glycosylhydrolase [Reichenbachiella sp.]
MKTKAKLMTVSDSQKGRPSWIYTFFLLVYFGLISSAVMAQAPSHDPSTMIRNNDGRYWIFTTGEGPWCMSSSNADFTDWRAETTPFAPGTYPPWIDIYVDGFGGGFWAPDIIKIGSTYYLYYSAAGIGAPAAIGLTTAPDLNGPWTDQGMVVAGNNAIDPALYMDNGRLWMSWGNWQSGIDICELSPSSGKRISGITNLVNDQVEGPGLIKNGDYYYLFYQRGLCCSGLNSSYNMVVARSTSITGPYTDERSFLANRSGNEHGPGHFGYGEGRLTYHYYAVNDNGAAKLRVTTLGWSNGWPVAGGSGGWEEASPVYRLQNRETGLFLDGMGRTGNGETCAQWADTSHPNSQWQFIDAGNGYTQLRNVGTQLYLDGMGRTSNGEDCGMWADTSHPNSHWSVQQFDGNYYRLQNRETGLFIDGMGRTDDGSSCGMWGNTSHPNAQWQLVSMSGSRILADDIYNRDLEIVERETVDVMIYPNPVSDVLNVQLGNLDPSGVFNIYNTSGQLMIHEKIINASQELDVSHLTKGLYFLELNTLSGSQRTKIIKN